MEFLNLYAQTRAQARTRGIAGVCIEVSLPKDNSFINGAHNNWQI